jgi:hypothetical protein
MLSKRQRYTKNPDFYEGKSTYIKILKDSGKYKEWRYGVVNGFYDLPAYDWQYGCRDLRAR